MCPATPPPPNLPEDLLPFWNRLGLRFPEIAHVFADCVNDARRRMSREAVETWLDGARALGRLGRGAEPALIYMEEMPEVVEIAGPEMLEKARDFVMYLSTHTNAPSIVPFLQTLAAVARKLKSGESLDAWLEILKDFAARTTGSVHGHHTTHPSPALPELLKQAPRLLETVSLEGLRNWIDYGVRGCAGNSDRLREFFSLETPDARAALQREQHGTLFIDIERSLAHYLRALWGDEDYLIPYSLAFHELRKPVPYFDDLGIHLPDVLDDLNGVSGLDRYRAILAHMAAHRRWSSRMVVDNWSPFQRLAVETFEDCRVDLLAMREYPGLRRWFLALHPVPDEADLALKEISTIRLRLAVFSRAVLDPDYRAGVQHEVIREHVDRFLALLDGGEASSEEVASLALSFIARTRTQDDLLPKIYFENTEIPWRDDNRHLWIYIENSDEEEMFEHLNPKQAEEAPQGLPPCHYDEWDQAAQHYRPDWVSLYEHLHPAGSAAKVDALLARHRPLTKRLERMIDMVRPQNRVRIRFQEDGTDLDLDVAIRSLMDWRAGSQPDPRINMSHRPDSRSIAVTLLLDLSVSLNETPPGCEKTILDLSQEAVSLLGWAVQRTGDPLAIGGFHSNGRHEVRYYHLKGFSEPWNDEVKARIAAMQGAWSTRMGVAMRHAGRYLARQQTDKKLLLVLTDGRPHDVDVKEENYLIADAHKAVQELDRDGVYTWCINLDAAADEYVADIFGRHYTVIDRVERLPERLPELFLKLTK
ncbi:MAG: hypothetical protein R8K47_00350 [Mariprofundaceae bacterium]